MPGVFVSACPQPRWRLGSTSLSLACMLRRVFSVVSQSMQASVMETPYFRSQRFFGIAWLPHWVDDQGLVEGAWE